MTIRRMRIECWIPKATNTPAEYEYLLLFQYNNGYTNVPEHYVIRTVACLVHHNEKYNNSVHLRTKSMTAYVGAEV